MKQNYRIPTYSTACLPVKSLVRPVWGRGVAIPHGRHACVKKATGAFIRTKEPVAFDAPDGKPVSLIFILLVPEKRYRRTFGSLVQTGRQILSKSHP